jgi:hypothetical protein
MSMILVGAILGFVFLVFALLAASQSKRREELRRRAQYIADYKFPDELRRRIAEQRPGLMPNQVTMILEGLRQYFLAFLRSRSGSRGKGPAGQLGMPSKAVDDAWHEFILMTRDYSEFCIKAFGEFLHHTPGAQLGEPMKDALANTLAQVKRPALGPAGWAMVGTMPLLFAIDRELGLADGFRYDDAAFAEIDLRRQAMAGSASGGESVGHFSDESGSSSGDGGGSSCGGSGGGCGGSS